MTVVLHTVTRLSKYAGVSAETQQDQPSHWIPATFRGVDR